MTHYYPCIIYGILLKYIVNPRTTRMTQIRQEISNSIGLSVDMADSDLPIPPEEFSAAHDQVAKFNGSIVIGWLVTFFFLG